MSIQLFDRIRAFLKSGNLFRHENLLQNQNDISRAIQNNEFINYSSSGLLDQTNLQINRMERYKDYDQMDEMGEISLALDLYADESCLDGNTRIPLLDGTCPTISELAKNGPEYEFWVYAIDNITKKMVPAKAKNARITKFNQNMVTVILDDMNEIRCTPDHKFMLKDGTFIEAKDLKSGDSLMPLYKNRRYRSKSGPFVEQKPYNTASEYDFMYIKETNHFISVHRWVYEFFNNHAETIHHKDWNGINNVPSNLEGMLSKDHYKLHSKCGAENHSFNKITLSEIEQKLIDCDNFSNARSVCAFLSIGQRVFNRVLKENGLNWKSFKSKYHHCKCGIKLAGVKRQCSECKKEYLKTWHQSHKTDPIYMTRRINSKRLSYKNNEAVRDRICTNCGCTKPISEFLKNYCSYSIYCNDCRPISVQKRYLEKSFVNHKVISVVESGVAKEVYDIEVPDHYCFAAGTDKSWVIVHNCQTDPEKKHVISIRAKNADVKKELERLFYDILNIDHKLRPMIRYLCKYGDFAAEIIPNENRTEVASYRPFNIFSFLRVETKYGDLVGFFFTDELMTEPLFLHPWQVMHLRLMSYENIYAPYGRSLLDGARKDFRRLRLMEDAALIYRITRAPEKRIFTIPVGNIPTNQINQYLHQISDQFKKQRFFDPSTGEVNWRYAPLIQEDDFWMPQRPDGTGPKVETMKGAENLDQIKDIEYFKKKMVAPLKIPFSRVGIGDEAGANADKSLSSSHTDFAKAVQFVQQEASVGLKKIALVHLSLKGFTTDDMSSFDVIMTASSAIDELYRIETWNSRAGVIGTLKETQMFTDNWILSRFTDMTDDEIEELQEQKQEEAAKNPPAEPGAEPGGMALPGLEEIDKLESKVLVEYAKMVTSRKKTIEEAKSIRYPNSWQIMLNGNELNGLPASGKSKKQDVITEAVAVGDKDPFSNLIPKDGGTEEVKQVLVEEDYIVQPLDDEDAEEAKSIIKKTLININGHKDTQKMSCAIMKISNAMDK